ncbi:hypothetical protein BK138_16140 [Paenibacillus rhizosphaerae]|uniref:Scaffolding protein n=1 Tax=Paenibacillus rhizosphaerae TaxID=297318 RepID=A0A1R1ESB6_9BACL|nr:DUF4355 domain-containing protein [Paenibacillus rhizosphaerae]OMF54687.1 hypothetical protein BK138_16140 [Paenibacillus rhizosphaerae]
MKQSKYRYALPLQLFAEGDGAGDGGDAGAPGGDGAGGNGGAGSGNDGQGGGGGDKTFTQDDIDKIVSKTIARERSKWEKDFETKLAEAKTEAEKLAKMNADQKAEYERQKREDELSKREGEITRRELRATALEQLAEKGLPKTLADILDYGDAESTNKSIEAVEKAFREAVEAGVNERLRGDAPRGGGSKGGEAKNPWKKGPDFNLTEQGRILREKPDLAAQLIAAAKQ